LHVQCHHSGADQRSGHGPDTEAGVWNRGMIARPNLRSATADNTLVHTGHNGGFRSVFMVLADRTTAVAAVGNLVNINIGTLGAAP
jgi:hypothetical protein